MTDTRDYQTVERLPFDVARCLGVGCDRKHTCERNLQILIVGPRTPVCDYACSAGNSYIERKSEKQPEGGE